MNIIFISIGAFTDRNRSVVYPDLLRCFRDLGHKVTIICQSERRYHKSTKLHEEAGMKVLRVRTGNITKTNPLEKGISTLLLSLQFQYAIRRYLKGIKYDLILYTTPPITMVNTVHFLKKHDQAVTYLMLTDLFSHNILNYRGYKKRLKGLITRYIIRKEQKLYSLSDIIGCMTTAEALSLLEHNPYLVNKRIEVCPCTIEVIPDLKKDIKQLNATPIIYQKIMNSFTYTNHNQHVVEE